MKGFDLYQINQMALKPGYNFTTSSKFTDTSGIEELQTGKPLSAFWTSISISRKRQAMGFDPLHHLCQVYFWNKVDGSWRLCVLIKHLYCAIAVHEYGMP